MNPKQIGILTSKILAIYALVEAAKMMQPMSYSLITGIPQEIEIKVPMVLSAFLPFLVLVLFAAALWTKSDFLGEMMDAEDRYSNNQITVTGIDLQFVAFSIIGLFILVKVVPVTVGDLLNYYILAKQQIDNQFMTNTKIRLMVDVLQFLMGFALIFGSKGLVGLVRSFRAAGNLGKD